MGNFSSLQGVAVLADGTVLLSRGAANYVCRYEGPENCTAVAGIPSKAGAGNYRCACLPAALQFCIYF
jgi:hypothetical protein